MKLDIATGKSRKETRWRNTEITWGDLATRLSQTHRTHETVAEYAKLPKPQQDAIKDIGGFVGGLLSGGRRKAGSVVHRQLLTLDLDNAAPGTWDAFTMLYDNAALVYSTHKHTPAKPRLRLVMPLARTVTPEEYEALGRRVAADLGIDMFDHTGYQPYRLMYWPSTSKDGVYEYHAQDGEWLDPDAVLARYRDWRDSSTWPTGEQESVVVLQTMRLAGDPTEKPGVVGAWCRTYDIHEALELLSDIYAPTDTGDGRWSYLGGTTAGGVVTYEDKWAYSHHGTDPAGGKLLNAFDLVRVHLYGHLDDKADKTTDVHKLPSYAAMVEQATKDAEVRRLLGQERLQAAMEDFEEETRSGYSDGAAGGRGVPVDTLLDELTHGPLDGADVVTPADPDDSDWLTQLDVDSKGGYRPTVDNLRLILEHDPRLSGRLVYNELEHRELVVRDLPWRRVTRLSQGWTDKDDSALRGYIEKVYDISSAAKLSDALNVVLMKHAYHPVRRYLERVGGLTGGGGQSGIGGAEGRAGERGVWDGVARVDTLLVRYLGAEDSPYVRAVTRKTLCAAVARAMRPGVKFDHVLTLTGAEGIGKSTLARRLGGPWFSDNFSTVIGKESYEQLSGVWIMEMCEMAGLKKAEVEHIKHFISKQDDRLRVAFGKRTETFPRQCIFIASTNDPEPLREGNGNRRFWVVPVGSGIDGRGREDLLREQTALRDQGEIDQIWSEAVWYWRQGEVLALQGDMEEAAREIQASHTSSDARMGAVLDYLDMPLPEAWWEWGTGERAAYVRDMRELAGELTGQSALGLVAADSVGGGVGPEGSRQDGGVAVKGVVRTKVCAAEIYCEVLGGRLEEMDKRVTREINQIIDKIPGWRKMERVHRANLYGIQRGYERVQGKRL
jgi:predicted P-loop ATPase